MKCLSLVGKELNIGLWLLVKISITSHLAKMIGYSKMHVR